VTVPAPAAPSPWQVRLAAACTADLGVTLGLLGVLVVNRIATVVSLRERLGPQTGAGDLVLFAANGLRFDVQFALIATLPLLLVSLVTGWWTAAAGRHRLRYAWWSLVATAICCAGFANVQFYREFGVQFDMRILEPLNEDLRALAKTVWQTYPVVGAAVASLALVVAAAVLARWLLPREAAWIRRFHGLPWGRGVALALVVVVGLVAAGRGSLWGRPLQFGTAGVTANATLNRLIPTPWHAIRYAVYRWRDLQVGSAGTALLGPEQLLPATRTCFAAQAAADLDRCTLRQASGPQGPVPSQIVILLLEGQSGFPLFARHRHLDLNPNLLDLAGRGLYLERFLPASQGTIYSLGCLFTGIPDSGLAMSLAPLARTPFPTSLAPQFAALGWRTRFVYGGYLDALRYGGFAQDQGFDEVLGIEDFGPGTRQAWGIDDSILFARMAEVISADVRPTLTLILSTSNHPPFEVDLAKAGFPRAAVAAKVHPTSDVNALGHIWYTDRQVGTFVNRIEARHPDLLVAISGDHPSRRWVEPAPPVADRSAVPLILYGPRILAGRTLPANAAGDHLDLLPTLLELVAPAQTVYHAWGKDLLGANDGDPIGTGAGFLVSAHEWIEVGNTAENQGLDAQRWSLLAERYRAKHGLGWWRLLRGPQLPAPAGPP
jgi:phosphoglycerol transferase MdoB-like AlkP superfamily enzyme